MAPQQQQEIMRSLIAKLRAHLISQSLGHCLSDPFADGAMIGELPAFDREQARRLASPPAFPCFTERHDTYCNQCLLAGTASCQVRQHALF